MLCYVLLWIQAPVGYESWYIPLEILKGRVTYKKILNSYLDFIGSVGLVDFFS